jgi:hypothetical protein
MVDVYRSSNFDELEAERLKGEEAEVEVVTKPAKKAATKVVKAED